MLNSRRIRPAAATAVLLLTATLAGCGGDDATSDPAGSGTANAAAPQCPPDSGAATRATSFPAAPQMCIDKAKTYTATVTTDAGTFTINLLTDKAPNTVNNFVFLARNKYYDGITFHRVIKGFMAQGGDPEGTGRGGPGYRFADELPQAGDYKVGSVAMANAGENTNGSQFFVITGQEGVQLPPQYTLFGQVASGMEVVKKIEADGSDGDGAPAKVHTMTSVRIAEK